LKHKAIKGQ